MGAAYAAMKSLAKFLIGVVLSLLTASLLAMRVYNRQFSFDPVFGYVYRPNHTVYSSVEGHGSALYMDHGVRRRTAWQPGGVPPIMVLGDSFTEAHQVNDNEVFTELLGRTLQSQGINNPVLNFSKSGYSVADYVALASNIQAVFRPTWVVIQVREDDFAAGAWQTDRRHFALGADRRTLTLEEPPSVDRQQPTRVRLARLALMNVPLIGFTKYRIQLLRNKASSETPLFCASRAASTRGLKKQEEPEDYPYKDELAMLSKAFSGRLTILFIASYNPRHPASASPLERALDRVASEEKVSFVNTRTHYGPLATRGLAPFGFGNTTYNAGHMNKFGHQVASDVLAIELAKLKANDLL
jgi:hypothetical protein